MDKTVEKSRQEREFVWRRRALPYRERRILLEDEEEARKTKGGRLGGEGEGSRHSSGGELRGAEATAWRAGPCVNGDVLNLC